MYIRIVISIVLMVRQNMSVKRIQSLNEYGSTKLGNTPGGASSPGPSNKAAKSSSGDAGDIGSIAAIGDTSVRAPMLLTRI